MKTKYFKLINDIIGEYKNRPIDLLNIGDQEGENNYLKMQRNSYIRSVSDICELFPEESFRKTRILEIGSFLGVLSIGLSRLGFIVSAYDIPEFNNNERLRQMFIDNDVDFVTGNLRDLKLPFDDNSIDCVIICETLEHLNFNPLPVLYEINRITRTGGFIYVGMPNQVHIKNRIKMLAGRSIHQPVEDFFQQLGGSSGNMIVGIHWREYTLAETIELLETMGYKTIRRFYWQSMDVYMEEYSAKTLIQRLIFQISSLKPFLVAIGRKERRPQYDFRFTDATR
jgi:SAM-dependent methyltransferase